MPWPETDFETLASDGAILFDRSPRFEGTFGTHREEVEL
jgi:hypothetical protein